MCSIGRTCCTGLHKLHTLLWCLEPAPLSKSWRGFRQKLWAIRGRSRKSNRNRSSYSRMLSAARL
jgi:hypothetical protein